MGHSNGRITAPVNTDDVLAMLGVGSHDVGKLCMSKDSINKWAKYKPEIINQPGSITLEQRRDNNFGLSPKTTYTQMSTFVNAVKNGAFDGGWEYRCPGANDWKRLDDFVGYNSEARSPFGTIHPYEGVLSDNTSLRLLIPCDAPEVEADASSDTGILNIGDFRNSSYSLKDWYFGILLYSPSRQFIATASMPIGTHQNWQVDFGWISPSYAGTYTAVPFLSSKAFTNGAEPSNYKLVGVGQSGEKVVLKKITDQYVLFYSVIYRNGYSPQVDFVISITNTTTSARTFSSVRLDVAKTAAGGNSTAVKDFGSRTVAASSTWSESGTLTLNSRDFQFCKLTVAGVSADWWPFDQYEDDVDA